MTIMMNVPGYCHISRHAIFLPSVRYVLILHQAGWFQKSPWGGLLLSCKSDHGAVIAPIGSLVFGKVSHLQVKSWRFLSPVGAQKHLGQGPEDNGGSTSQSTSPGSAGIDGTEKEISAFDARKEAFAAVAEFLVRGGLSENDASWVSARAPVYAQTLMDADRELTEVGILSLVPENPGEDAAIYRFRLLQRAYQSSGRQLTPFLEAIGIHVSQIPRIAHQLSGRKIAELLVKVRFLEKLVACLDGGKVSIENQLRVMMKRLSLDIDDDLQKVLSLFARIEAQPEGLCALNLKEKALALVIETFPHILIRSVELQLQPVVTYLEDVGIPPENLGRVILCFPPCLLYDVTEELKPRMKKLRAAGVRARDLGRMTVKYPWLLSRCVEDNIERTMSFLDDIKVPKSKLDRAITKYPLLLGGSCTRTFQPIVQAINAVGVKSRRLGGVIADSPNLLLRAPREFQQVVEILRGIGIDDSNMKKVLLRSPEVFSASIDMTLRRNLNYLEELGIPKAHLGRVVRWYPEVLSMSVAASIQPRMAYLQERGIRKQDVALMVRRFPPIVGYSVEAVFKPKLDFLTDTMGKPLVDVVKYPRFFSYSLEKRIKPRAFVLAKRKISYDLAPVLFKTDEQFAADYMGVGRLLIPTIE